MITTARPLFKSLSAVYSPLNCDLFVDGPNSKSIEWYPQGPSLRSVFVCVSVRNVLTHSRQMAFVSPSALSVYQASRRIPLLSPLLLSFRLSRSMEVSSKELPKQTLSLCISLRPCTGSQDGCWRVRHLVVFTAWHMHSSNSWLMAGEYERRTAKHRCTERSLQRGPYPIKLTISNFPWCRCFSVSLHRGAAAVWDCFQLLFLNSSRFFLNFSSRLTDIQMPTVRI